QSWWPILEAYHPVTEHAAAEHDPTPTTSIPIVDPAAAAPAPAPVSDPTPTVETPIIARTTSAPAKPQPIPAEAPQTASTPVVEGDAPAPADDVVTQLKGMSKTLATNMDASLTVPTATSGRTVPAKLMIDN